MAAVDELMTVAVGATCALYTGMVTASLAGLSRDTTSPNMSSTPLMSAWRGLSQQAQLEKLLAMIFFVENSPRIKCLSVDRQRTNDIIF